MSHAVTLHLRATLQPAWAEALAGFCAEWACEPAALQAVPDIASQEVRDGLAPAFADACHDPALRAGLCRHRLDLDATAGHGPAAFDYLLDVFLPEALQSLESGYLAYEGAARRTVLVADPATRRLLRRERPAPRPRSADARMRADARWLAGLGDMPALRWRKALAWWLEFVGDLPRQQAAFTGGGLGGPIDRWEDLQDFYCTALGLGRGLGPAVRNGYLSAGEAQALRRLDHDFRGFLPWDDGSGTAMLRSPAWIGIARRAGAARAAWNPVTP